jgi:hypothetical protein
MSKRQAASVGHVYEVLPDFTESFVIADDAMLPIFKPLKLLPESSLKSRNGSIAALHHVPPIRRKVLLPPVSVNP